MRFRNVLLTGVSMFACLSWSAVAQDWPIFRGPSGDGHAAAKNLPLEWSKTKNIAWRVEPPGTGWSSPILVEGKLYFTAAVTLAGKESDPKADRALHALCLSAADGKTLWDAVVFAQSGANSPGSIHQKNSHASPTPVYSEGKLYVHFGHQGTACLDMAGKKLWENRTLQYEPQHGAGSTPILVDNRLIFSCDGSRDPFVAALKITDGSLAWKFKRPTTASKTFAFCTPECITTAGGKKMIISPGADMVNALDPATGAEIWRCAYEGYSTVPKPVFANGLVYVCSSFDTPDVLAIRPEGSGDITETNIAWQVGPKMRPPCTPSMIADGKNLFWVSDSGLASCVDALTGETFWCERVGKNTSASPILADGKLYFLDETGLCTIVAATREFKVIAENRLEGERTLASMAATEGTLFVRTEKALYCIRGGR